VRRISREAPTTFTRLDDAVTSADRFLNVRDLQIARQNYNFLLAYGVRQGLVWQMDAQAGVENGSTTYINPDFIGVDNARSATPFLRGRVLLGPMARYCICILQAGISKSGEAGNVYAVLSAPRSQRDLLAGDSVGITNVTILPKTIRQIPVPSYAPNKFGKVELEVALYYTPETYSAIQDSAVAITAATATTISVATAGVSASTTVGDVMYFDDATIEPRVISARDDAGGTTTFTVRKPWFATQPSTANTLNTRHCSALLLNSVTLYEAGIADFDDTYGAL